MNGRSSVGSIGTGRVCTGHSFTNSRSWLLQHPAPRILSPENLSEFNIKSPRRWNPLAGRAASLANRTGAPGVENDGNDAGGGGGGGKIFSRKQTGSEDWGWHWMRRGMYPIAVGSAALFSAGPALAWGRGNRYSGGYLRTDRSLGDRLRDALNDDRVQTGLVSAAVGFAAAKLLKTLQFAALLLIGVGLILQLEFYRKKRDPMQQLREDLHTLLDSVLDFDHDRQLTSRDLKTLVRDIQGYINEQGAATVSGFCIGFALGLS